MAHGVKRNTILKVHQALHGYADGHQQLSISAQLMPRDIKTMLVLSDLSGPGVRIDDDGYLTGYPLPESKMYALARTWSATEMPRPGCVWTHTLLIDFADLATLDDPSSVLALFRRPNMGAISDYKTSLSVPIGPPPSWFTTDAMDFAKQLLAGLYGEPHKRVISVRPAKLDVDPVVLALWAQQWPRLRRSFRFCTLSAADRSSESGVFDLQLLPSMDRSVRPRFKDAVEIVDVRPTSEDWLDDAVTDLMHTDISGLRTFLRRIGGDVDDGREAFRPLCRLHVLVQKFKTSSDAIEKAIELLDKELATAQARAAREIITNAALENADQLNDVALEFLVRHLEFAEPDVVLKHGGQLGRELWRRNPERLHQMLEGNDLIRSISTGVFLELHVGELIDGIKHTPKLATTVLARRPELVAYPGFWSRQIAPIDAAFDMLHRSPEFQTKGLTAMMEAGRNDLAIRAVREFGPLQVLRSIASLFEATSSDSQSLTPWLVEATTEPAAVAKFLADKQTLSWSLLSAITHLLSPDAVPNEYGIDPWLIAVQSLGGVVTGEEGLFLYAYLLARALGPRSRSAGELAIFSFEPIHVAVSADRLPNEAWEMLEKRLPRSFKWLSWDRCPRIRTAVGNLFVENKLSPNLFPEIAQDDELFVLMAETVADSSRGRRFLKRVRSCMSDDHVHSRSARIKSIEKLVE